MTIARTPDAFPASLDEYRARVKHELRYFYGVKPRKEDDIIPARAPFLNL